jgi:hypothetical protein
MSIIKGLLYNGYVGVRINDVNSDFLLTNRGGDPISSILFNFMVDVFTKVLVKADANRHLSYARNRKWRCY